MKKIYILASLLLGASVIWSCDKTDKTPVFTEPEEFVFNTPAYAGAEYDLKNSEVVILTCSQPDYGFTAGVDYTLNISLNEDMSDAVVVGTYNSATLNVESESLAIAATTLLTTYQAKEESDFPILTPLYANITAKLTTSGKGEITSNTVKLEHVNVHFALPPVELPKKLYMVGSDCNWDWNQCSLSFIETNNHPELLWRILYFSDGATFKFNSEQAWDNNEFGYEKAANVVDNAGAGLSDSDGNFKIENGGWYLVYVVTEIDGRKLLHTVTFEEPNVYLTGTSSYPFTKDDGEEDFWVGNAPIDANLFTVPETADGDFVSPAFYANTSGDGGLRAHVKIEGCEWWHTEFMVFGNKIEYRATGGDQERVSGAKGQKLYLNFSTDKGEIK